MVVSIQNVSSTPNGTPVVTFHVTQTLGPAGPVAQSLLSVSVNTLFKYTFSESSQTLAGSYVAVSQIRGVITRIKIYRSDTWMAASKLFYRLKSLRGEEEEEKAEEEEEEEKAEEEKAEEEKAEENEEKAEEEEEKEQEEEEEKAEENEEEEKEEEKKEEEEKKKAHITMLIQ
jgi:flagellar biosynthesis GTPase FlhF